MLDRKAWAPPTVDELRVSTNPKVTYGLFGHEGPAQSEVQNLPIQGKVEKNRPDTDFALGPEHWLTTTGSSLGPTQISEQMVSDIKNIVRLNIMELGGNSADANATYIKGHYEPSHKSVLCNPNYTPANLLDMVQATLMIMVKMDIIFQKIIDKLLANHKIMEHLERLMVPLKL